MPAIDPSAADFMAALTSSIVTFFASSQVRSTIEPSGVGTRTANPSSLPSNSGITNPIALAAPVLVGIIDIAAARARRRSLCGPSRIIWSLVYEWIVFINPLTIPNLSLRTLATGARQLVVQDAFEINCMSGVIRLSLTPRTTVRSTS